MKRKYLIVNTKDAWKSLQGLKLIKRLQRLRIQVHVQSQSEHSSSRTDYFIAFTNTINILLTGHKLVANAELERKISQRAVETFCILCNGHTGA